MSQEIDIYQEQPQREARRQAAPVRATHGAAGAPPSNTAPANCSNYPFKVLRQGIDSLYLSFPGQLKSDREIELSELRRLAQSADDSKKALAVLDLDGHQFEVSDRGWGKFKYVLQDSYQLIKVASSSAKSLPLATTQVSANWLAMENVPQIIEETASIISELGQLEDQAQVSRADIFVDFVAPYGLHDWDENAWVTRALQKSRYSIGNIPTGWMIGAGGIRSARLYDKTKEIKKSGKEYLKTLWAENGWDGECPVYRLEFQLKREALREHDAATPDKLLSRLGVLWEYATQEWLRLTIPSDTDQTQTRWPNHPMWEDLSKVEWLGTEYADRKPVTLNGAPSMQTLSRQILGAVTSHMAVETIYDPEAAVDSLWGAIRKHHLLNNLAGDKPLEDWMLDRAANKARKFGLPYNNASEQARKITGAAIRRAYEKDMGNGHRTNDPNP
jgi:hypothetical protein